MDKYIDAQSLSDEEREEFVEEFYNALPFDLDESEASYDWGHPWYSGYEIPAEGTIKERAAAYADLVKDEILGHLHRESSMELAEIINDWFDRRDSYLDPKSAGEMVLEEANDFFKWHEKNKKTGRD